MVPRSGQHYVEMKLQQNSEAAPCDAGSNHIFPMCESKDWAISAKILTKEEWNTSREETLPITENRLLTRMFSWIAIARAWNWEPACWTEWRAASTKRMGCHRAYDCRLRIADWKFAEKLVRTHTTNGEIWIVSSISSIVVKVRDPKSKIRNRNRTIPERHVAGEDNRGTQENDSRLQIIDCGFAVTKDWVRQSNRLNLKSPSCSYLISSL